MDNQEIMELSIAEATERHRSLAATLSSFRALLAKTEPDTVTYALVEGMKEEAVEEFLWLCIRLRGK